MSLLAPPVDRARRPQGHDDVILRVMAQPSVPPPGFDQLSTEEKLEYIQALWDHFSEHAEEVPVPDWHRQVVAERLAAYRRGEITSGPWSEVREELLARLRPAR
jgi:putative addiction module component (TIGR02574 family)